MMEEINHAVRKSAHFSAYLVLGILVVNALRSNGIKGNKLFWLALITLIICRLYSCTDELHQMFVPGRTALITDVMIDSAGAAIGIGLNIFLLRMMARRNIKKAIQNQVQVSD